MRPLAFLWLFSSAACSPSIAPPYLLDDLKIVALVAEPPDIAVGQTSSLRTYLAAPQNPRGDLAVTWTYCRENDGNGTLTSCADPVPLIADSPRSEQPYLFSLGATIGGDPATLTGVSSLVQEAGFWVHILVEVRTREGRVVQAQKRLVISNGNFVRNTNPRLNRIDVWQGALTTPPYAVHVNSTVQLVPDYDATAFQQYEVLNSDGTFSLRNETAQLTWYVSTGSLNTWQTQGDGAVNWSLPASAVNSTQTYISVLRDGRGGTSVSTGSVQVVP